MAKNRQSKNMKIVAARKQVVFSKPRKIFKEKYLSPKGKRLILSATTKEGKKIIWKMYGKNRYKINPDARPIKEIIHES